jgi:FkbM family methyltransferase
MHRLRIGRQEAKVGVKINWKRAAVSAAWVAVLSLFAFFEGVTFGRTYERYKPVYAATENGAIRGSLSTLVGREKSYGQFQQDLWVTRGVAPGKRDGYYVDVGSADGELISNTKLLDDLGWKGVCIDPFPKNMGQRTCQVFRQPVFSESGKLVKFRAAGNLGGIDQDLNRYKSTDAVAHAPMVEFVTATLDGILAKAHAPKYIDYMNLDVEGAEYDVLRGLSFDRYQIGSLTVEHNYEMAKREAIHNLLAAKGYVRVRSWEVDDWYVHGSLVPRYQDFIGYCSGAATCPY